MVATYVSRYGRADTSFGLDRRDHRQPVDRELGTYRARAAALPTTALPGSVHLYQGEELGLWEVEDIPDERRQDSIWHRTGGADPGRDGCRAPLPWAGPEPRSATRPRRLRPALAAPAQGVARADRRDAGRRSGLDARAVPCRAAAPPRRTRPGRRAHALAALARWRARLRPRRPVPRGQPLARPRRPARPHRRATGQRPVRRRPASPTPRPGSAPSTFPRNRLPQRRSAIHRCSDWAATVLTAATALTIADLAPATWGTCATSPAYRGLCATSPIPRRDPIGVRGQLPVSPLVSSGGVLPGPIWALSAASSLSTSASAPA